MAGRITTAVVLAAGRGTRLHPITNHRSKAMLPILGVPMIERILQTLASNGLKEFIIVARPDDHQLIDYFKSQSPLRRQSQLVYQVGQKGMADALLSAAPFIKDDFILSACDNFIPAEEISQFLQAWESKPQLSAALAVITVAKQKVTSLGIVSMRGEWVTGIVEKPSPGEAPSSIASLPLYCFSPRILDYLPQVKLSPRGEYELQDAIQMLIEHHGKVCGVFLNQRFSLTVPADLLGINLHFLSLDHDYAKIRSRRIGPNTRLIPPLHLETDTVIGSGCTIGPNVYIEQGCQVGGSVIIQDSVLLDNVCVPSDTVINHEILY